MFTDVVEVLVQAKANVHAVDGNGRGCLQLASRCQGDNQVLYNYLKREVPSLEMTYGEGRPDEDKSRGMFSHLYRRNTGPLRSKSNS